MKKIVIDNMVYICHICENSPGSHSFDFIGQREGINNFYSCPGNSSKYDDYDGIINHIDKTLEKYINNPWNFILDCSGFGLNHLLQFRLSIDIVRLVTRKYSEFLCYVYIINSNTFITSLLQYLLPFTNEKIKNKIIISDKNICI